MVIDQPTQINLNAARQNLQQQQTQALAAQQQAHAVQQQLQTQQALRSGGLQNLQQRQVQQQNISAIQKYSEDVGQQANQLESYLKTPSGIKQSAIEAGTVNTNNNVETVSSGSGKDLLIQNYPKTTTTYTSPFGYGTATEESGTKPQYQKIAIDNSSVKYNPITTTSNVLTTQQPQLVKAGNITTGYTIETPTGGMSYQFINPLPQNKPIQEQSFKESQAGRSLLGIPAGSLTGTINYLGGQTAKIFGNQPITYSDILPYQLRGTAQNISPTTKITPTSFFTPQQIQNIQTGKSEAIKQAAIQTAYTAPTFIAPVLGTAATSGFGGLYAMGSAESLFTPKAQQESQQAIKQGANPLLVYGLPVAGLIGGGLAVSKGFENANIQRAINSNLNPTFSITDIGQPNEAGKIPYYSQAAKTSPPIGFAQPPINLNTGEVGYGGIVATESRGLLNPVEDFYQIEKGQGITNFLSQNPINGQLQVLQKTPFTFSGDLNPSQSQLVKQILGVQTATQQFPQTYTGKLTAATLEETPRISKSAFGGFPIATTSEGNVVLSGNIKAIGTSPTGELLGKLNLNQLGIVRPEGTGTNFFIPFENKAAVLLPQEFTRQPIVITPSSVFSNLDVAGNVLGGGASFAGEQFFNPARSILFPLITTTTNQRQISFPTITPSQKNITTVTTKQIPVTVTTPKTIETISQVPYNSTIENQQLELAQIQLPVQQQLPIQTSSIINPAFGINPQLIPPTDFFQSNKKEKKSISKRKAYNVLIKRRGKFFEIGKSLPFGQASKLGANKAITTLARTFQLQPAGETSLEDISYNISPAIFRAPKRPTQNPLTFVQRVGLNRGTGEVTEIQAFKRMKSPVSSKNIFTSNKKSRRFKII